MGKLIHLITDLQDFEENNTVILVKYIIITTYVSFHLSIIQNPL
jgi:hypothetical protein